MPDRFLKYSEISAIQGGGNGQLIPLINALALLAFGDSITAGYGADLFKNYIQRFANQVGLGIDNVQLINKALSGSGLFYSASQGNQYIPINVQSNLIVWMAGLNDCRYSGSDPRLTTTIEGTLTSFLAACFLKYAYSGQDDNLASAGTWTNYNAASIGGKSPYLSNVNAAQSVVSGSTKTFTTQYYEDTVVIGTFSDDGQSANALGAFDININGVLYMTYTPTGRNNGNNNVSSNTLQGQMPEAIIIQGVENSTIEIVTKSTTPTIIDYIGVLQSPQNCPPVMVSLIPQMSTAGYEIAPANATPTVLTASDNTIKSIVSLFPGYPVVVVNPNNNYDPSTQSADGIHPNDAGALAIANNFLANILGGIKLYQNPNADILVNGLTIGQGSQTVEGTNQLGACIGHFALANNTTGYDNVAIGGLAGQYNTSGCQNVFIGRQAGYSNTIRNNNIYIGYSSASNSTGYSNVVIGANAQLPNADDSDSMLIRTGEGSKWIMLYADGLHVNVNDVPVITAAGASSAVKIPFNYNGTQYYLLATTS